MNFEIFLNFIRNKENLKNKIKKIKSLKNDDLLNKWHHNLPDSKKDNWIAIDGSYNYIKFRSIVFYVINVSLVIFKDSRIYIKNYPVFDIIEDFIFLEDFLRFEMIRKEIEVACLHCNEFNIMLDGSLISFLNLIPNEERKKFLEELKRTDKFIIAISKTYPEKFFEGVKNGFSDAIEKFKKYGIVSFYFKLRKNALIFKAEIFEKNINRIEEIVSNLRFFEFKGYPYILRRAHREAKISNSDMEKFVKLLSIKEKTGREIL